MASQNTLSLMALREVAPVSSYSSPRCWHEWLVTFPGSPMVGEIASFFTGHLILEEGNTAPSRNLGHRSPSDEKQHFRRMEPSVFVALDRRLREPQSRFGLGREKRILRPLQHQGLIHRFWISNPNFMLTDLSGWQNFMNVITPLPYKYV